MINNNDRKQNSGPQPGGRERRRGPGSSRVPREKSEFDSRTLDLARVTRVTKGGKRFSFRSTVVIGDGKGRVGIGVAQGNDVSQAIQKATSRAKRFILNVPIFDGTIPHSVESKYGSAVVLLKPAPKGNGLKAGGSVRAVVSLAGIENISSKLLTRTKNKINIARAAISALSKLKTVKPV